MEKKVCSIDGVHVTQYEALQCLRRSQKTSCYYKYASMSELPGLGFPQSAVAKASVSWRNTRDRTVRSLSLVQACRVLIWHANFDDNSRLPTIRFTTGLPSWEEPGQPTNVGHPSLRCLESSVQFRDLLSPRFPFRWLIVDTRSWLCSRHTWSFVFTLMVPKSWVLQAFPHAKRNSSLHPAGGCRIPRS